VVPHILDVALTHVQEESTFPATSNHLIKKEIR